MEKRRLNPQKTQSGGANLKVNVKGNGGSLLTHTFLVSHCGTGILKNTSRPLIKDLGKKDTNQEERQKII